MQLLMRLGEPVMYGGCRVDNADFSYKWGAKRDRKRKGSKLPRQSLAAARALAHGKEISAKSKLREVSSKVEQSRLRLL